MTDLNICPNCGGEADNGHDRCYPSNTYWCKKCSARWEDAEAAIKTIIYKQDKRYADRRKKE